MSRNNNNRYNKRNNDEIAAKVDPARRSQMISVSTRAVGLNLVSTVFTSTQYSPDIKTPDIYKLYRICLALFEAKMRIAQDHFPIIPRYTEHVAHLLIDANFEYALRRVTILPEPISKIINALGVVTVGDETYLPVVPKDENDKEGHFIPRAEVVTYSNLRKVVIALSQNATPIAYRKTFYANCCIPGAKWKDNLLLNPDEIIPSTYSSDDLARDILVIAPWLNTVQKHFPKLVSGAFTLTSSGKKCMLISNEQGTLRIPDRGENQSLEDYYKECNPEGNIKPFSSPFEMTTAEQVEGALCLLGERTRYSNFLLPLYVHRLSARASYEYNLNWLSAVGYRRWQS